MFGVGMPEMALIAVVALLVFGPKRLPELAQQIGRALARFRTATRAVQRDIDRQMHQVSEPLEHLRRDLNPMVDNPDPAAPAPPDPAAHPPESAHPPEVTHTPSPVPAALSEPPTDRSLADQSPTDMSPGPSDATPHGDAAENGDTPRPTTPNSDR